MRPFWSGFFLALSLCMDLGLVNIVTLRISLTRSANAAFLLSLGSVAGDLIYFALVTAGATALLASWHVRVALWIVGTIMLLFLAARAIREVFHPHALAMDGEIPGRKTGLLRLFGTGLGLALASPSAILWFAAVGGSVIASYGVPGADNRRVLGIFASGFAAAGIAWAAAFAYGAAALKKLLGWRLLKALSLISAGLFLYFAYDVFTRGWRELAH
ncbi:MAG: LysE family transporter [Acidobacteriota bacterium]